VRRQDASHRARVVALVRDRLQRNVGNTARCKRIFYTIYALCTAKPSSHDTTISTTASTSTSTTTASTSTSTTTASTSTSTVPPAPMANTAASFVNPYRIEFEQLLPALLRQLAADASRSMAAALKSATPRPPRSVPPTRTTKVRSCAGDCPRGYTHTQTPVSDAHPDAHPSSQCWSSTIFRLSCCS